MKLRLPEMIDMIAHEGQWQCQANGKNLTTPKKNPLCLPNQKMIEALQQEAKTYADCKDPDYQIFPRLCNVIDNLYDNPALIHERITSYGMNDLLCYRCHYPEQLQLLEEQSWQRWLNWAEQTYQIRLQTTQDITRITQSPEAAIAFEQRIVKENIFARAALLEMTEILGSAILALALADLPEEFETLFAASLLHETFQAQSWGETEEYQNRKNARYDELTIALHFYQISV